MWNPPDPDEPTSEVYRLMPPRRKPSEVREALDALGSPGQVREALDVLNGNGPVLDATAEPLILTGGRTRRLSVKAVRAWTGALATGVLASLIAWWLTTRL